MSGTGKAIAYRSSARKRSQWSPGGPQIEAAAGSHLIKSFH